MRTKLLLIITAILGAAVLFIPLLSRPFLTRYALHETEDLLQTRIEISSAEFQLLEGGIVLRGINIYHPSRKEEKIVEVGRAALRVKFFPLLYGELAGVTFEMDHPRLVYATTKTGDWEIADQIPLLRKGKGEKRLPVNIDEIVMKDGEVEYRDGRVGMTTKVTDIDLKVTHVRLPTEGNPLPARFKMSFEINRGADFKMEGRADFLSPKITFESEATLSGLPLPPYAPYYDHGLPVRITRGSLSVSSKAKCEKDYLKAPAHAVISGLQVEPKQAKIFGFASNTVVDALKNKNGNVEMDMMISGNIRNPQFHLMTDLTAGFMKEFSHGLVMAIPNQIGDTMKGVGEGIKKGGSSGLGKIKGLFR